MASGVASLWTEGAPNPTFEGVNVVMYQQSARYIFKLLDRLDRNEPMIGYFTYMNNMDLLMLAKC
jgi:hypothetical protein